MEITRLMTGTKLELELYGDNGEKIMPTFVSQFEWLEDENTAVIAAPIFEGVIYPVRVGWNMYVYFQNRPDLFCFRAVVTGRGINNNIAYLRIVIQSAIEKIQRRYFYRFDCSLPIKFQPIYPGKGLEGEEPYKTSYTRDISGGGVCIKLEEKMDDKELIACELELFEHKIISFTGRIVRFYTREDDEIYKYEMGVLFEEIDSQDNEAIIRYVFEEQRKLRKKGLI